MYVHKAAIKNNYPGYLSHTKTWQQSDNHRYTICICRNTIYIHGNIIYIHRDIIHIRNAANQNISQDICLAQRRGKSLRITEI